MSDEQLNAFKDYWLYEASTEQKALYLANKDNNVYDAAWGASRQTEFTKADLNSDGVLDEAEAKAFLTKIRVEDAKTRNEAEDVDRHWKVASILTVPST